MIFEEYSPKRIQALLASCVAQQESVVRLIVETKPMFHPDRLNWLLGSPQWTYAVNPNIIIDPSSKHDQTARAQAILDLFGLDRLTCQDKTLLDFGCGQGYVAAQTVHYGATALGYDINLPAESLPNTTNQWTKVVENAPYDIVIVYDVLDHCQYEHPIDCLRKISNLLTPEGKVYLRCHPWCSRTGNHSYINKNKAFIHYFFTDEELEEINASGIFTHKIIHPITTYNDWILKSGFTKIKEDVKRDSLEPFWQNEPIIKQIICSHWKNSYEESLSEGNKFPQYQMEISFVDFVLQKI